MSNPRYHYSSRQFDRDFDKNFKRVGCLAFVVWAVGALVSLALAGVIIWAVIALVTHFTA